MIQNSFFCNFDYIIFATILWRSSLRGRQQCSYLPEHLLGLVVLESDQFFLSFNTDSPYDAFLSPSSLILPNLGWATSKHLSSCALSFSIFDFSCTLFFDVRFICAVFDCQKFLLFSPTLVVPSVNWVTKNNLMVQLLWCSRPARCASSTVSKLVMTPRPLRSDFYF